MWTYFLKVFFVTKQIIGRRERINEGRVKMTKNKKLIYQKGVFIPLIMSGLTATQSMGMHEHTTLI